jgi:hypothetical protein
VPAPDHTEIIPPGRRFIPIGPASVEVRLVLPYIEIARNQVLNDPVKRLLDGAAAFLNEIVYQHRRAFERAFEAPLVPSPLHPGNGVSILKPRLAPLAVNPAQITIGRIIASLEEDTSSLAPPPSEETKVFSEDNSDGPSSLERRQEPENE